MRVGADRSTSFMVAFLMAVQIVALGLYFIPLAKPDQAEVCSGYAVCE